MKPNLIRILINFDNSIRPEQNFTQLNKSVGFLVCLFCFVLRGQKIAGVVGSILTTKKGQLFKKRSEFSNINNIINSMILI